MIKLLFNPNFAQTSEKALMSVLNPVGEEQAELDH